MPDDQNSPNGFLIPEPKRGSVPFVRGWFARLAVKRINALLNLKVQEGSQYDFKISDANAILTIKRQIESTGGGASLTVYKVTGIGNVGSDYISGKSASFDNSNTETLASSAENIAVPWALRNAQAGTRDPEYAVNDYILVTTCDDGTGVAVSSVQLTLQDIGIGRIPGGKKAERFRIRSSGVHADYLTCETWDGSTGGGSDVLIAKNPKCRHVGSESIEGTTINYTYASRTNNNDGKRTTDGSPVEDQIVIPVYIIGDEIYAIKPTRGTGVSVSGTPLVWQDLNLDGRAWAQV